MDPYGYGIGARPWNKTGFAQVDRRTSIVGKELQIHAKNSYLASECTGVFIFTILFALPQTLKCRYMTPILQMRQFRLIVTCFVTLEKKMEELDLCLVHDLNPYTEDNLCAGLPRDGDVYGLGGNSK